MGVPASVTLAQYALESGYGTSDIAKNKNNYFGMTNGLGGYQKFSSMEESFDEHGKLLGTHPIYKGSTIGISDSKQYVKAIASTYAEDPEYYTKITQIMERDNLLQYDNNQSSDKAWWDVSGKIEDTKNSILSKVIKITAIIGISVLAFIFFFNAFDLPLGKKQILQKTASNLIGGESE